MRFSSDTVLCVCMLLLFRRVFPFGGKSSTSRLDISVWARRRRSDLSKIRGTTPISPQPPEFAENQSEAGVYSVNEISERSSTSDEKSKGNESENSFRESSFVVNSNINEQLQQDIAMFKTRETAGKLEENAIGKSVKDIFAAVLIADFFLVIFFLVWFLFAAALQSTNAFFLEKFQDIFQPVVVPSLTVLMVGSIASGVMAPKDEN